MTAIETLRGASDAMNGRIVIAIALAVLAAAVVFAARPHEVTADERIDQITTELRCPVCQGLSVKDSTSETARQMRDLVAQRVREGKSNAEIEAEFRAAYGDWIFLVAAGRIVERPGVARSDRRARGRFGARVGAASQRRAARTDRAEPDAGRRAARTRRARGSCRGMTIALFVVLLLAGTAAVIAPLARRPIAWPADPPDHRDDVARAVSSLRDLEFARAAGTIAPSDYARLRASLERDAFARRAPESRERGAGANTRGRGIDRGGRRRRCGLLPTAVRGRSRAGRDGDGDGAADRRARRARGSRRARIRATYQRNWRSPTRMCRRGGRRTRSRVIRRCS